jgi:ribonucleotide reductase alpha subunit
MVTTAAALTAVPTASGRLGLKVGRFFTKPGVHPYDEVAWELRDAVITDYKTGAVAFEQRDVEFPTAWSMNATTIVAQKYFRGALGTPERERSVRQMIDRVADTITDWGRADGYFADEASAEAFNAELKHILVTQKAAFNSPVWFNLGVPGRSSQASACFILSVDDTMSSILNWYVEEGTIFKGGSGAGVNLSKIRSSLEQLKGGGTASGPVSFMRGADASAGTIKCLHADTPVATNRGVVRIADVQPGWEVLTRHGFKRVEQVHDNGIRPLVRVRTELGDEIVCTPEHRFHVRGSDGVAWRQAKDLRPDDYVLTSLGETQHGQLQALTPVAPGHHNEIPHALPEVLDEAVALWLGWVYGDGSITTRKSAKFIAMQLGDGDAELMERYVALTRSVFGDLTHIFIGRHRDKRDASASVRFCSSQVIRFLEENGLRKARAHELRVPPRVQASPPSVRAAFLAGVFEADGHVSNGYPYLSTVSSAFAVDVHRLLLTLGIPSKLRSIRDRSGAYGSDPVHTVRVVGGEGVRRFAKLVGFISERKSRLLEAALTRRDDSPYETQWFLPHVERELDILWQQGDGKVRRALAPYTHYARPRRMSLLRARALFERFPEALASSSLAAFASGYDLYQRVTVEPGDAGPTFDLTVEDVHEYLVHNIVTHNSGGTTRRAAKMVILDVDHPDIEEFIWCKQREEQKARALRDAGFDMDLDGRDSASIQYQNANNSVRVNDEFMRAVLDDRDFDLKGVTTGQTVKRLKARELMRQIAKAAWECADPGMQYDTTINDWHTTPNAGRINASNPCCFTGETLVETSDGLVRFDLLEKMAQAEQRLPLARSFDIGAGRNVLRQITHVWVAGEARELVELRTEAGLALRCTPEHRFMTLGGYVAAEDLEVGAALRAVGQDAGAVEDVVVAVDRVELDEPVTVYDLEVEQTHNFATTGSTESARAVIVSNSEYMHLDNSACNLASLNLRKFEADGVFDTEAFKHAVEVVFTAQEIIVGNSSYPTEKIAQNARAYRQLGLGYANLGGLLMSQGLAYDSDEGRAWAGAITALMTGHAYRTSAELARVQGPFDGFAADRGGTLRVIAKHKDALADIDASLAPVNVLDAARRSWADALELGTQHGIRNAQASVLAPTGCLVGGSLVPTERGLVRLASLGDPAGAQWQDLDVIVGTDEGPRTATKFYVNGLESVVTVDTARGYRIQGTPRHRIKVVQPDGEWVWKRFEAIAEGDLVPLSLDQLIGDPQTVTLPPLAQASGRGRAEGSPVGGDLDWTGEHHARAPRTMTPELAEFLGYFMGDGSLHARGIRLCVAAEDFDVVEHLARVGKGLFGLDAHIAGKTGYTEVSFNSVRLVEWWQACGFAKHEPHAGHHGKGQPVRHLRTELQAHIPDAVLHANDPAVYAAFVRGLFEADGTVNAGYPHWATTSLTFSHDVQALLLALGYPTTRKFDTTGWGQSQLAVLRLLNSAYNGPWLDEIGFLSDRKNAAVGRKASRQAARADKIPVTRALIERVAPGNDRLRRVLLLEHGREGRVSRRIAMEAYERSGDAELGHLLRFFYDTVATAELGDDELTYDLSVPQNVTYVANGFVSHNTIGLMMDCDTTGIEPDLGLVKSKKLVGGGTMRIVNRTVPAALERLGYQSEQVEAIVAYIDQHATIEGAPAFKPEHLPVFDCAMGERTISPTGHIKMMAAVQPWISGAISKCILGETLVTTEDGLVRIGSLHRGEEPDSFRDEVMTVASLNGEAKTDAFYYGGVRKVRKAVLRSGHTVTGTENHRLLVAGDAGLEWRYLDEMRPGEYVAVQYGANLWSPLPARFDDFQPTPAHGNQIAVALRPEMTEELAFLLGAYVAEGHVTRKNWTITITNSVDAVLERVQAAWASEFGVEAKIVRQPGKCPGVKLASKTVVEFLDYLGCGDRASRKRIPDAVLRSPKPVVLAFLQGLALDAYAARMGQTPKWAICLDSSALLDDLQAVLTNLGIVHSRISKYNPTYDKTYDEVYACGDQAQRLFLLVPFLEPDKAARARSLQFATPAQSTADVVPGIKPRELYGLIPRGKGERLRTEFSFLGDPGTKHVSWTTLERVAAVPGVDLPAWLRQVLTDNLHFSPVVEIDDAGAREVFDLSVPTTHAFVGNGIVNHNTVNLPESATVEDVEEMYLEGWKLGLKAVAIYRDNCKVAQPLSIEKKASTPAVATEEAATQHGMVRRRLPKQRPSQTISFSVGDAEGYLTAGEYPGDGLGEIFVKLGKQGSTLSGVMDAFAISVSLGLQYGVPLEAYVKKFTNMRFEPAGMTDDPEVRFASSLVDYIFRRLAIDYLPADKRQEHGIYTLEERQASLDAGYRPAPQPADAHAAPPADATGQTVLPIEQPKPVDDLYGDAPMCYSCGIKMQRAGSCHVCTQCGTTSGCS